MKFGRLTRVDAYRDRDDRNERKKGTQSFHEPFPALNRNRGASPGDEQAFFRNSC